MIIKVTNKYKKYTNGLSEIQGIGTTLGEVVKDLLQRYPQLYVFLMEGKASEGFKAAMSLDGEAVWSKEHLKLPVTELSVLELNEYIIPSGSGKTAQIIVGIVLIIVGVLLLGYTSGGSASLIIAGVGMIVGALLAPDLPTQEKYEPQNYTFSGIKNTTQEGTPLGIVYGTYRVGGHWLNVYVKELGSSTYLYGQLGLCEGEIEAINDVVVNERPEDTFVSLTTDKRYGTADQTEMSWFHRTANSYPLGTEIVNIGSTWAIPVQSDTITVSIGANSFFRTNDEGKTRATDATYLIQYREFGSTTWNSLYSGRFTAGTKTDIWKDYIYEFPTVGDWELRFERTSAVNADGTNKLYVKHVTVDTAQDKLTYPNTALLGVRIKANDQLHGNLPVITSEVLGRKVYVPTGYNGSDRSWDSAWDGSLSSIKQWTNNPIWCLYDLFTDRMSGLGEYLQLDADQNELLVAQLVMLSDYCDDKVLTDLGQEEPRFSLDMHIADSTNAQDLISEILTCMRAHIFYSEGLLQVGIDRPLPMTQIFTNSSIIKDTFSQASFPTDKKYNVVEVQYSNKDNRYQLEVFRLESRELQLDSTIEERKQTLTLKTVTSYTQALRLARYLLLVAQTSHSISFKTGTDSLCSQVGDVIGIQNDTAQWGEGGRIATVDGLYATLSHPITYHPDATDFYLNIKVNGLVESIPIELTYEENALGELEAWDIKALNGEYLPVIVDDTYAIGVTTNVVAPFKIVNIAPESDDASVELTCVSYHEDLYAKADDINGDGFLVQVNHSTLEAPTHTGVSEFYVNAVSYIDAMGTVRAKIEVFYTVPIDTNWDGAVVSYREEGEGDETWIALPINITGSVEIDALDLDETYEVIITSVFKDGTRQALEEVITGAVTGIIIEKDSFVPADITELQTVSGYWHIDLSWGLPEDSSIVQVEVWASKDVNDLAQASLISTTGKSTQYTHQNLEVGVFWYYWVRPLNAGNISGRFYPIDNMGGVQGTPSADPEVLLELLDDSVNSSSLSGELRSSIELLNKTVRPLDNARVAESLLESVIAIDDEAGTRRSDGVIYLEELNDLSTELVAEIERTTLLASEVSTNASSIISEGTTRADADSAMASDIVQLTTDVGTNASSIISEGTTRADADSAMASDIVQLTTDVGENSTTVAAQALSIDGLSAQYTIKIDNNGNISGIGLMSESTGDGGVSSTFGINADTLFMTKPGVPGINPFVLTELDPIGAPGAYTLKLKADVLVDGNISVQQLTTGQLDENATIQVGSGITINGDGTIIVAEDGGIAGNDYVILTNGQLQYMVYNQVTSLHEPSKYLRNVDSGIGLSTGVNQQLSGVWKNAPHIICSLQHLKSYDGNSPAQDQSWTISYDTIDEGQGKYSFTPTATLTKGGAVTPVVVNEVDSNSTDGSGAVIQSSSYTTSADTVNATISARFKSDELLINGEYQNKKVYWRVNYGSGATDWKYKALGDTIDYVSDAQTATFSARTASIKVESYFADASGTFGVPLGDVYEDEYTTNSGTDDGGSAYDYSNPAESVATLSLGVQPVPSGYVASDLDSVDYTYEYCAKLQVTSYSGDAYVTLPEAVYPYKSFTQSGQGTLDLGYVHFQPENHVFSQRSFNDTAWRSSLTAVADFSTVADGQVGVAIQNVTATLHYSKAGSTTPHLTNTQSFDSFTYTISGSTVLADGTVSWVAIGD